MPSPVGHMIAGVAAGWLVKGAPDFTADRQGAAREALAFAALAALPDLDLLVGAHSGPTHSIGAAAIVAGAALLATRTRPVSTAFIVAAACFAAYGSHVLLDWLSTDSKAPIGVMALWPFSREHFESDLHVFMAITRRVDQGWAFVRQNALALVRELAVLLPVLGVVVLIRSRRRATWTPGGGGEATGSGRAARARSR